MPGQRRRRCPGIGRVLEISSNLAASVQRKIGQVGQLNSAAVTTCPVIALSTENFPGFGYRPIPTVTGYNTDINS